MAIFVPDFRYVDGTITDFLNPRAPILDGAWGVQAFVANGDIYAYISASIDHGIQLVNIFELGGNPFEFAITDAVTEGLYSPRDLEMLNIGTSTFLITASFKAENNGAPGTISVFLMDETPGDSFGDLTLTDTATDATALHGITDFTVARIGPKTFIYGVSTVSDTISVVSVGSDGTLGQIRTVTEASNPALPLDLLADVAYARFNNDHYIVSAANFQEGMGLWRIAGNGTLTLVDTAKPHEDQGNPTAIFQTSGLHVAQISKIAAVAFAYDSVTRSVVSYQILGDELLYRGAVAMGNTYINEAMVEMKTLAYMGETYLVTSDAGNNTVSLFHVNGDGSVTYLRGFSNGLQNDFTNGTAYLQQSQGLDIVEQEGRLWVVATSASGTQSGGVTMVEIGGGPSGAFEGDDANDKFFNFSRDTLARGNGGDDLFRAGTGKMNAYGGAGHDDWRGNDEDEYAYGGSGNDTLSGGGGNDRIYGGAEAGETIDPNEGDADLIYGSKGADTVRGGVGNDSLYGGDGIDVIHGDFAADKIFGGRGNDLIYAGLGDDTIDGGIGRDDFVFSTNVGPGDVVIDNFEVAADQIKFKGPDLNNMSQVIAAMVQDGSDVVITMPIGNTVTLTDIQLGNLTAGNFLFG